jgi:cysteine-S-conjugate beta-lyase
LIEIYHLRRLDGGYNQVVVIIYEMRGVLLINNFDQIVSRRQTNSEKWTHYPEDVLPFWVADMDFPAPPAILEALHISVSHGVFGYESLTKTLRETIADRMEKLYGWKVDTQAILATPGIVSGFNAAAMAYCEPGEGYLIQPPVYMPFNHLQHNHGFIRQEALLELSFEGNELHYKVDWDAFNAGFNSLNSKTRIFLLCSPHNPTGQVYSKEELLRMAEICIKEDVVIVSDEIHSEILLGKNSHTPIASLSPEIANRSVTLIAPSKTFNIPGLFCGFAIIPNSNLRANYIKAMERMTLHVNSLGLIAAQTAFSGACDEWLKDLRSYLTSNRDFIVGYIKENIPEILTTVPDATYLAWFDCSGLKKSDPYKFFLKYAKVAMNDGAAFGTGGKGFVRFNFGTSKRLVAEGLERMKKAVDEYDPE